MGKLMEAVHADDEVAILDAMIEIICERLEDESLQGRDAASLTKRLHEMRCERRDVLASRRPESALSKARGKRGKP